MVKFISLFFQGRKSMEDRYINPFTDFGFKRLFGAEEPKKDILIDFLNSLLKGKEQIKDLTYGNNEQLALSQADRKAIFDLYCENDRGEKFIVEIQKDKATFVYLQMPNFNKTEEEL
jgi:predicted transposase/invertase (TIGR01784 family)